MTSTLRPALFISVAAVLSATGLPASAHASADAQRAAAARGQGEEVKYCIREQLTGTRMYQTFCKTRQEWERQGVELPRAR